MVNEAMNKALYSKMEQELADYRKWLMGLPTEEVLSHSYEYTVRQDILYAFEEFDLGERECSALLKSPCPLSKVLDRFNKLETDYMENIRWSIEEEAKSALLKEKQHTKEVR